MTTKHELSMSNLLIQFLIGGMIVATVTALATTMSPLAASIVTAFPIGLIPMFFIHKRSILTKYGYDTTLTNMLVVISYVVFDFLVKNKTTYAYAPVLTILTWCTMAFITFMVLHT
jgi:uncharacterized membrane protein (GlpM family)